MTELIVPDPTLLARLQVSARGVDWASSLLAQRQFEQPGGEWSAHQHLFHLLAAERTRYRPHAERMVNEEAPVLAPWDPEADMRERYSTRQGLATLAGEFTREREETYQFFRSLLPEQWHRRGAWPGVGLVDVAWVAERAVEHALEHFVALLRLHGELEFFHAEQWERSEALQPSAE